VKTILEVVAIYAVFLGLSSACPAQPLSASVCCDADPRRGSLPAQCFASLVNGPSAR